MQNTENISELINIFSKVSRYRVNTEILLIFCMPKRNMLRKKLEMVRHLKKLKKTLKDGMTLRGIDRINIANGLYYQKDRHNVIAIKSPMTSFTKVEKNNPKIPIEAWKALATQRNPEQNKHCWRQQNTWFQSFYLVIATETLWYRHKVSCTDQ